MNVKIQVFIFLRHLNKKLFKIIFFKQLNLTKYKLQNLFFLINSNQMLIEAICLLVVLT